MTQTTTVNYRIVGFGAHEAPAAISTDRSKTEKSLSRASERDQSGCTRANTRIYGYATRAAAKAGDISDNIGRSGRVR